MFLKNISNQDTPNSDPSGIQLASEFREQTLRIEKNRLLIVLKKTLSEYPDLNHIINTDKIREDFNHFFEKKESLTKEIARLEFLLQLEFTNFSEEDFKQADEAAQKKVDDANNSTFALLSDSEITEEQKEEFKNRFNEIKPVIRKILKFIHPDQNPDIDPALIQKFNSVHQLLKDGDFESLEQFEGLCKQINACKDNQEILRVLTQFERTNEGIKSEITNIRLEIIILKKTLQLLEEAKDETGTYERLLAYRDATIKSLQEKIENLNQELLKKRTNQRPDANIYHATDEQSNLAINYSDEPILSTKYGFHGLPNFPDKIANEITEKGRKSNTALNLTKNNEKSEMIIKEMPKTWEELSYRLLVFFTKNNMQPNNQPGWSENIYVSGDYGRREEKRTRFMSSMVFRHRVIMV